MTESAYPRLHARIGGGQGSGHSLKNPEGIGVLRLKQYGCLDAYTKWCRIVFCFVFKKFYFKTVKQRNISSTGVYLLDFFCSGIQFNLLLSPYPCFISLLYLDLYVLGDDALIS